MNRRRIAATAGSDSPGAQRRARYSNTSELVWFACVLLSLLAAIHAPAAQETRVAILAAEHAEKISDVLTAKLSGEEGLVLLERDELRKVLAENELQLAQAVADPAKAGSLLGADVLLVIEGPIERDAGKSKSVSVRLVFVNRGIVLYENVLPLKPDGVEISDEFALPDLREALHKAGELREAGGNAVAIHLDRILADNGRDNDLRMQLASLFSRRMQREKGWVVVERRRLLDAAFEQETRGTEPQRPVTSTHRILLGFSQEKDQLLFRAHVECAASSPVDFRFEGSREKLSELADAFAREFANAANLKADATAAAWDPLKEAEILHQRALKMENSGGMIRDTDGYLAVYELASAAWALGLQTLDVSLIRLGSLARSAEPYSDPNFFFFNALPARNPLAIKRALAAIDLTREHWRRFPAPASPDINNWWAIDTRTLEVGGALLLRIYQTGTEKMFAAEMPELRAALRELAADMPKQQWRKDIPWEAAWRLAIAAYGSLWVEDYRQAQAELEKALTHPPYPTDEVGFKLREICEDGVALGKQPNLRYTKIGLIYPRAVADEEKCRELETALGQKLLRSSYEHVRHYGYLILQRLEVAPAIAPPVPGLQRYLVPTIADLGKTEDAGDSALIDPFYDMEDNQQNALILQLLKEAKPGAFLKYFVVNGINALGQYRPSDLARIAEELDDYRVRIQDEKPKSESESGIWTDYLHKIVIHLSAVKRSNAASKALANRYHESPPPPADQSLIVNQFWFLDSERHGTGQPDFTEQLAASSTHLFYMNHNETPERGVWVIDRQNTSMRRISTTDINASVRSFAIGAKFFRLFKSDKEVELTARCSEEGRREVETRLPVNSADVKIEAVLGNEVYITGRGHWEGDARHSQRLCRWNLDANRVQMLADNQRDPPANPLDVMLRDGWNRFYSLETDGSQGIFTTTASRQRSQNPAHHFYRIAPGEPVVTAEDRLKQPPLTSDALQINHFHNKALTRDELILSHPLLPDRMIYHAPFRTDYSRCTARFPESVFNLLRQPTGRKDWGELIDRANPYLENSVTPFVISSAQGCVIIERNMVEEERARGWLAFFETDRIRSIPLRFEIPETQLPPLLAHLRQVRGAKTEAGWTPRPNILDQAFILDDSVVITNERVDGLWFIPIADIEKARQRAR